MSNATLSPEEIDTRAEQIRAWLESLPLRKTPMTEEERAGFERLKARAEERARTGAPLVTFEERIAQLMASETDPGRKKMYEDALASPSRRDRKDVAR